MVCAYLQLAIHLESVRRPYRVVARWEKLASSRRTLACCERRHPANTTVRKNGASMPDGERGSGLGDRSHGGGLRNPRTLDPVKETYKPIATGPDAAKSSRRMRG